MKQKLKNLFRDYAPGDHCDGLIAMYQINTRRLEDCRIIKESNGRWIFLGFHGCDR